MSVSEVSDMKIIDEYIQNKGIIRCTTKSNDIYYLDIEEHKIYTENELLKLIERKWKCE